MCKQVSEKYLYDFSYNGLNPKEIINSISVKLFIAFLEIYIIFSFLCFSTLSMSYKKIK